MAHKAASSLSMLYSTSICIYITSYITKIYYYAIDNICAIYIARHVMWYITARAPVPVNKLIKPTAIICCIASDGLLAYTSR